MVVVATFCFFLSVALTALVVVASRFGKFTLDTVDGPQKFHSRPTPRVGGVGIWLSFVIASIFAASLKGYFAPAVLETGEELLVLVACSLVVLAAGLGEDVTKRVPVGVRLFAAMISGALAFYLAEARLTRLDVWFLDILLRWNWFALFFTAFAVAGIANAVNIVDGYNGLAGGYAVLALAAIAFVAFSVGDFRVLAGSLLLCGAILGFLVWNYPRGRIFLGDAGAYFVGFMIAEWSLLLVQRHTEVSPWFPLLIVAYPVWETLFSIYRKRFLRKTSPGAPDGLHLHMLVYKRLVRWKVTSSVEGDRVTRNSMTAPFLWILSAIPMVAAVWFWDDSAALAIAAFSFGALYNIIYRAIVRFTSPRWLVVRSEEQAGQKKSIASAHAQMTSATSHSQDAPEDKAAAG